MKKRDLVILGVGALALFLLAKKEGPLIYKVPETKDQRWTRPAPPEPVEKKIYPNTWGLVASVPFASLVPQAKMVSSWEDIPTSEGFGVYGVDKGTYQEFYYNL